MLGNMGARSTQVRLHTHKHLILVYGTSPALALPSDLLAQAHGVSRTRTAARTGISVRYQEICFSFGSCEACFRITES